MMDASKIAGWVVLPDGQRTVCPRCQGAAFIRLNNDVCWGYHAYSLEFLQVLC